MVGQASRLSFLYQRSVRADPWKLSQRSISPTDRAIPGYRSNESVCRGGVDPRPCSSFVSTGGYKTRPYESSYFDHRDLRNFETPSVRPPALPLKDGPTRGSAPTRHRGGFWRKVFWKKITFISLFRAPAQERKQKISRPSKSPFSYKGGFRGIFSRLNRIPPGPPFDKREVRVET
jgi:hypothetical protein